MKRPGAGYPYLRRAELHHECGVSESFAPLTRSASNQSLGLIGVRADQSRWRLEVIRFNSGRLRSRLAFGTKLP